MKYVYLHGFASGPGSTKARVFHDHFARERRELLVPDLSDGDFEHLTITGQLSVVDRTVAGEPAVLIGSSMGGYLAALFAARYANIARLLLLAPAFGFIRRWPAAFPANVAADWRRTGWMDIYHYGEGRICRLSSAILDDAPLHDDYPNFPQPALIYHGTRDTVVPPAISGQYAAGRANVVLRLLDSGHELVDVAGRIWEESREFLLGAER